MRSLLHTASCPTLRPPRGFVANEPVLWTMVTRFAFLLRIGCPIGRPSRRSGRCRSRHRFKIENLKPMHQLFAFTEQSA